jgi:hypothetical protein
VRILQYDAQRHTLRAIGATAIDVVWLVARSAMQVIATGAVTGLAVSAVLDRMLTTMLFGVMPPYIRIRLQRTGAHLSGVDYRSCQARDPYRSRLLRCDKSDHRRRSGRWVILVFLQIGSLGERCWDIDHPLSARGE